MTFIDYNPHKAMALKKLQDNPMNDILGLGLIHFKQKQL